MPHYPDSDPYISKRIAMVQEQLRQRGIRDSRLLEAMERVPRHEFIPLESWDVAYGDHPVPIGEGQTVSQPYIVAVMLQWLDVKPEERVLEVGTGTGYEAAVLAEIAAEVVTVERQPRLAQEAIQNFERLGYRNIRVIVGDGTLGVPDPLPFDGIVVAAASPDLPAALWEQLREGGRIVIPTGSRDSQVLKLIRKKDGAPVTENLEAVRFVPLVGKKGFPERDF